MTTLVTGAAGFIGLNAVQRLLQDGHAVLAHSLTALPDAARTHFATLPGALTEAHGDVRDVAALRALCRRHPIRRVLHLAAVTAGPATRGAAARTALEVNIAGSNAVIQVARESGVTRLVLTSSSAVYGEAPFEDSPVTESTPVAPLTVYGYSKVAAEALAIQARDFGLDTVCARLTAIYGPWEHDTGVRDTLSPPFQVARAALRGERVLLPRGGHRDWTSSTAIAGALATLLQAPSTRHACYNLGIGRLWHPSELCEILSKRLPGFAWAEVATQAEASIAFNDDLSRPRRSPPLATRFETEFGALAPDPQAALDGYAEWVVEYGRSLLT